MRAGAATTGAAGSSRLHQPSQASSVSRSVKTSTFVEHQRTPKTNNVQYLLKYPVLMPESRRPGRWRTGQQSKQRILDAARKRFMSDGYERATVRAIAADAGVDVAMVYYFFDNKEGLINAAA